MDANRFDTVSKLFASRRMSRRRAVTGASAGLAAGALATVGLSRAAAQEAATPPAADAESAEPTMLFIQSFQAGSIAPKEGTDGRYTLTLESGLGRTIYFSDRPDRIVGAKPTGTILDALGFPADNPPNAALVVENAAGATDVAVVELFSPVYDEATRGLTYEIAVLENWEASLSMGFSEAPTDLAAVEPSFGSAHLFIDGILDCPDHDLVCYPQTGNPRDNAVGTIPNADHDGFCVETATVICNPCQGPAGGGGWADECNRRFAACNGNCTYWPFCTSLSAVATDCAPWDEYS